MGAHPANLAVRFLLELSAYFTLGLWGWHRRDDGFRILIALAVPVLATVLWGLSDLKFARLSVVFAAAVAVHYAFSYDRIRWLVDQ
jgi:hypothetical protein